MSKYFIYSVLQYKHSLSLKEILNVGVLFYFPEEQKFEFVSNGFSRIKGAYPMVDTQLLESYIKEIEIKLTQQTNLFINIFSKADFLSYIHKYILAAAGSGLVFANAESVQWDFTSDLAIREYSKLLLPGINTTKFEVTKHSK